MAVVRVPGSTDRINTVLEHLFRAHGIGVVRQGDVVRFPAFPDFWMNGEAFNPQERAAQLDFRLCIAPGVMISESFAGIGRTPEEQINDGIAAFVSNSFHVLLRAFFGVRSGNEIDCEEWEIGGLKRAVFVGTIGSRFGFPTSPDGTSDIRFFDAFKKLLIAQPLTQGTHWVRLYQMRIKGQSMANEVLLDNHHWAELAAGMAAFEWPVSEKYYDVRQFLVIEDLDT